jgi:hypothetical protein
VTGPSRRAGHRGGRRPRTRLVSQRPVSPVSERATPPARRRNGVATAALVVSAAGVVFAYLPLGFVITLTLGALGMVLAAAGRRASTAPTRRGRGHGTATAAAWTAGFALLLGTLNALATWNATRLPADVDRRTPTDAEAPPDSTEDAILDGQADDSPMVTERQHDGPPHLRNLALLPPPGGTPTTHQLGRLHPGRAQALPRRQAGPPRPCLAGPSTATMRRPGAASTARSWSPATLPSGACARAAVYTNSWTRPTEPSVRAMVHRPN